MIDQRALDDAVQLVALHLREQGFRRATISDGATVLLERDAWRDRRDGPLTRARDVPQGVRRPLPE